MPNLAARGTCNWHVERHCLSRRGLVHMVSFGLHFRGLVSIICFALIYIYIHMIRYTINMLGLDCFWCLSITGTHKTSYNNRPGFRWLELIDFKSWEDGELNAKRRASSQRATKCAGCGWVCLFSSGFPFCLVSKGNQETHKNVGGSPSLRPSELFWKPRGCLHSFSHDHSLQKAVYRLLLPQGSIHGPNGK